MHQPFAMKLPASFELAGSSLILILLKFELISKVQSADIHRCIDEEGFWTLARPATTGKEA
jgi:hypothetical protein